MDDGRLRETWIIITLAILAEVGVLAVKKIYT